MNTSGRLPVSQEELDRCVACGLCLPACPTWRVTGREAASPRGRIAAMRAVHDDGHPVDDAFVTMMEECVQCRGCEPVCPAFVPFGHLMEGAREALAGPPRKRRPWRRRIAEHMGYRWILPHPVILRLASWMLWLLQRLGFRSRLAGVPRLAARDLRSPVAGARDGGEPVVLFTGCVMDAWMRPTHRATIRVIEAAGGSVAISGDAAGCCGALHAHAGRSAEARRLAQRVVAALAGTAPVLVNSAGCGAMLRDYGRVLGTPEGEAFAARVRDVHEWLEGRPLEGLGWTGREVVVQDPCHLRHVQGAHGAVRSVLGQAYALSETPDAGLCCGAGGAYAVLQPALATAIRDRKVAAIRAAGGADPVVASANPGCAMHLAAGGVRTAHPMELLAAAMTDVTPSGSGRGGDDVDD